MKLTQATDLLALVGALTAMTAAFADEPGVSVVKVPRPVTGEQVYRAVCQGCHMADARGATGAATIPALANNAALSSSEYLLTMVHQGRGAMPGLGDVIDDRQTAAVATYIRTHFGNRYRPPVTVDDVHRVNAASR